MSTITTIQSTDAISASRSTINTNFSNLNTDKAELSGGTFTRDISVPDEAYGVGWNGSTEVPTKNAIYDKIETLSTGSVATDTIWDAKGDLAVGTGANTASRLAVGTNGQVLTADSAEATGVKWATVSGTGDVTSASTIADNAIVRGDGGAKGVQQSNILINDTDTISNINSIKLNTSPSVTPAEGEIYWDSTVKNLMVRTGYDSVTTDIGREMHKLCRNNTGSTILNGKVVYINGVSTNPTIALAQANDYTKTAKMLGVTTMDIANGADGLVTIMGQVHDLNTSGFSAGDILFLDSSTAGGIVNTNPTGINHTRIIGRCDVSHATAGIISVEVGPLSSHPSDEFKVTDATDTSKQMTFNVSGITAGTKRTFTVPNQDVTLVGDISTQTLTNKSISLGTNTITTTKSQLNTAVTDGDILFVGDIVSSSTTAQGIVELATTSEINTGTDSTRAMPVDQYVASNRNVRYLDIYAIEKGTDNAVGTNIAGAFECPFTGTITEIGAYVETAGTTGASVWDVNKNGTTIMTTNKLSIDSGEVSTRTAATAPTLTTTAITAGDLITIDTDSLSTTKPKGLHVRIGIRLT